MNSFRHNSYLENPVQIYTFNPWLNGQVEIHQVLPRWLCRHKKLYSSNEFSSFSLDQGNAPSRPSKHSNWQMSGKSFGSSIFWPSHQTLVVVHANHNQLPAWTEWILIFFLWIPIHIVLYTVCILRAIHMRRFNPNRHRRPDGNSIWCIVV